MKVKGGGISCVLVSFSVIYLVATPGARACPRRCTCFVPTEVHCTFRYLTSIPDSIPASVERINLGYNSLVRLTETDFSGLNKLELLMLHSNGIHTIPDKTFSDLQALQVLKMSYNKVRKLQKDTFYGLRSLTRLHMDHNNIEFINPEVFYGLTFLRLLFSSIPVTAKPPGPNTWTSKGKSLALIPAAAFLCAKPTIDSSLKSKSLTIPEDSSSVPVSPQDFMAPLGSLTLNMTDQSGNEANMVCSIQKPSRTSPIAFTEENDNIMLNTSFSTWLVCHIDYSDIQPVWQVLALYSDSPLILERSHLLTETPQLCYKYKQVAPKPEDIFTNIEADLRADPSWLMQDQISLQLNRTATTLSALQIQYSGNAQVTLPRAEMRPVRHKWTMISRNNSTKLEHTVTVGGTIDLICPGQGDPTPHLEWLLADGSKVRAPYVSEDGRILIDKSGKLELQMADSSDTGIYHCISTNYDDADILTYRVTVVEPSVEDSRENGIHHTVFTGETLDLPCHSSGIPDASISWVLPGNTILSQSSRDKQILNNGTLRIFQVAPKDQGHYHCVAANPSGVDFLTFQVSVRIKGQRPGGLNGDTDGSGLGEPSPFTRLEELPDVQTPTSAPVEAEVGKHTSSDKHSSRELMARRHGDSRIQRFREYKRQFPPSARRIDPQHWAALLEKAKKNAGPGKHDATGRPPPLVTQLLKTLGPQDESSGMLPPDEEFMVLATEASDIPVKTVTAASRSGGPVTNPASGAQVSPIVSPQIQPPGKPAGFKLSTAIKTTAMSEGINPTISSKLRSTVNQDAITTFPLLSGVNELPDTDQIGRREYFRRAPPVTVRTVIRAVNIHMLNSTNDGAGVSLKTAGTMNSHQTSVTGVPTPGGYHLSSHVTRKLSTSRPPSDPNAARFPLQISKNSTTNTPPPRRFGRRRGIWGRGRIISQYRTPVLRRHRYGIVRPTFRGPSGDSTTAFPAPELNVMCLSCPRRGGLATATAMLPIPSSLTPTHPRADTARITSEDMTTLVQNPSLPTENKPNVDIDKTTPTIKYFSVESTQVSPADVAMIDAPTSLSMETAPITNIGYPSGTSLSEARRDSGMMSAMAGPVTEPAMPTTIAISRFSTRKIPWHRQIFGNNLLQKERLKNWHKFGFPKSTTVFLKISPALPTDRVSPFHFTTPSARMAEIPSVPLATTNYNTTQTHSPRSLPTTKMLPFQPINPTLPSITNRESSMIRFAETQTATLAAPPTATASAIDYKTQTARPTAQKIQGKKEPQNRNDPSTPPSRGLGSTAPTAVSPPALTTDELSVKPTVSAFTHSPLENTDGIWGTIAFHSGTFDLTDVIKEPPPESAQTLKSTTASETTLSSESQQSRTGEVVSTPPTAPPLLSSGVTPMPVSTSPPLSQSAAIDMTTPVFSVMTNTEVKPHGPPGRHTDPQRLAAELATSPEARPDAKVTTGTTHIIYSNLFYSTLAPAVVTVKPQSSKWTPSPWSENQFWHKSYPEIAEKGKKPVLSMVPTLSLPEANTHSSNWDGQKNAEKSGFDKKPVERVMISELPPFDSLFRDTFEKPRIVGGKAASFTVTADSDAFLPCEAAGNPPPTIRWTRVSSGLDLSKRKQDSRFQVLSNGTLSIQRVDIQDRGQYLCSASNLFGTDRLHVTLSVVSYPPRILETHTKEVTVHSGSTVELKCRAEGRPNPTISWILANQTVISDSSKGNSQALVMVDGTLVIHDLSVYDRGFYKCIASNPAGQDSLLVKIQVIAAPPVILEQKRQVVEGTWGESLKLPCTAKGTPQPRVHWVLSDGTAVKPLQFINSKLFLFSNGTLYIRNIASSDRGTYECIATSSTGSDRRVVLLTTEERDTIPRIEAASQKWTEVNLGDQLLLNCSATGEPKPKIIWRLPSKAVVDQWHRMGSRIHVYPNGSLLIGSVTEKDGGDYLCVARNKMGDDLILMHVSLRLKPAKIDHKQYFKKQVLHGKELQVDCKASGSPVPEISWSLPDGTMVNNAMQADDSGRRTRRYVLFNNGTLYFHKVGVAEEGDYTCYAQNTLGKDEMKVHLTVITAAPRIKQGYKTNMRVKAGDIAVLDCEVTGEPKPQIFWLLPSSDKISFSNERYTFHANGSLSISKVKLLDSGEYVCVARNPSGDDTKMYQLDVVSRPPLINGRYRNRTVIKATAVRHSKKHFDCRAEGTPPPQIMWIMPDNIFLTAPYYGSRISVHPNGTLEIRNVRFSDSADFICVARNDGGESVLVVQLQVLEMLRRPTFRNPFNEKVVAHLGKSTALNCSVDGNPPPEIIWILPNGTQFFSGPPNPQYLIASNGSLIIYKTTRDDAGKYRCAARNKVGYIEKLIVLEIGQKPVILTYALGTVRRISGESLWLHCVSDGIPKPSIKWTLPSGHVIERPQVNGKYVLHENGTLVIKEATAYDRGNYICQAQNSAGRALITVPVTIVAYPPRITNRLPRSIRTRTGAAFQLHCVALGVPKPEITWEVPDHSLLSVTASQEQTPGREPLFPQGTLVIQNPQTSDSGVYKCTAKNPLGSDYATTYIQVI
ncbi:Immunoglobulin superfamily member 10 [Tupaia chinensis]|nr:Immunoglobulin superfamily member 10 [Tupaia chinensis]